MDISHYTVHLGSCQMKADVNNWKRTALTIQNPEARTTAFHTIFEYTNKCTCGLIEAKRQYEALKNRYG